VKKSLAREIGGVTNNREINDINKNILLHSENKNKNDTFIIEDNFNYLDLLFKLDIENLGKKGIKEGDFYDFMVNFNRNPLSLRRVIFLIYIKILVQIP